MVEIRWTLQAFDDLESIVDFIAKDSPQYARLFVVDIFEATHRLVKFPNSGRIIPKLTDSSVRKLILGSYRTGVSIQKGHRRIADGLSWLQNFGST